MKDHYRIVTDEYCGYQVQIKCKWFPFCYFEVEYVQGYANTHETIDKAKAFIKLHKQYKLSHKRKFKPKVVYDDRFDSEYNFDS